MLAIKPRFSPERSFQHEVRSRVEERLATLGRPHHGGRRIYLKTALLLLWSSASYVALLTWARSWWQVVPLSVSLGLALAHQIEHHLFPRISHVHLPVIADVVEQVCRESGVRYSAHATLWKAVASHYSWLRSMGQPVLAISE